MLSIVYYDIMNWIPAGTFTMGSPTNDPTGPASGKFRANRGGSWNYLTDYCRSASRNPDYPPVRDNDTGFRVVRGL